MTAVVVELWWIVGAGAVVGLFFVGRALVRRARKRRELAEQRDAGLRRRADRQHRWLLTGDERGVYGAEGASARRAVSPGTIPGREGEAVQGFPNFAAMVATADEVTALAAEKPPGWRWAMFASVLVRRTALVLPRLRDSELGFTPSTATRIRTGPELARILVGLMDEMSSTVQLVETFMLAPAFMAAFGDPADESTADAEAVQHMAHRLMDYHERFLQLSERCRDLSAPSQYADVIADCGRLLDVPLQGYRDFTAEFVDLVEALPQVLQHASGVIEMGTIELHMEVDDHLMSRTFKRLRAISQS